MLQLEDEIQNKVQNEVDRSQREFYLREQMKAIQTELGEGDIFLRDIAELREKIETAELPEEARKVAVKEMERLIQMPSMAPEVGIIRTYLDWILELPWTVQTEDNLDVDHAAKVLEAKSFWPERCQRPHSGIYRGAQLEAEEASPADPVFRGAARDGQNLTGSFDCRGVRA